MWVLVLIELSFWSLQAQKEAIQSGLVTMHDIEMMAVDGGKIFAFLLNMNMFSMQFNPSSLWQDHFYRSFESAVQNWSTYIMDICSQRSRIPLCQLYSDHLNSFLLVRWRQSRVIRGESTKNWACVSHEEAYKNKGEGFLKERYYYPLQS